MLLFDEDLSGRNRLFCLYLEALGRLGHGKPEKAQVLLVEVLAGDSSHAGANAIRRDMANGWRFWP
jgi:hypothetical protein